MPKISWELNIKNILKYLKYLKLKNHKSLAKDYFSLNDILFEEN